MSLKENKDKTSLEKEVETRWAEDQLGIELESFDPLYDPVAPLKKPPPKKDNE